MKTLEQGQEKIRKICDALRSETLEPAKVEAAKIIEEAKAKADQIVAEGRAQRDKMIAEAHAAIEQERTVFHSSLEQSEKQVLDSLRLGVEQKIFNEGLQKLLAEEMGDPKVIGRLIDAIVKSIEKEGLSKDFAAIIPQAVSAESVNLQLMRDVQQQLGQGPMPLGDFSGGVQIKLIDKKLTLDVTDKALCDFLKSYVRKDFRKLIFNTPKAHPK